MLPSQRLLASGESVFQCVCNRFLTTRCDGDYLGDWYYYSLIKDDPLTSVASNQSLAEPILLMLGDSYAGPLQLGHLAWLVRMRKLAACQFSG